jgi:hypothetical protein
MQIQDVITRLSVLIAALSDIKMQKVRAEITELQAKRKAAAELKKAVKEDMIGKAIEEWI